MSLYELMGGAIVITFLGAFLPFVYLLLSYYADEEGNKKEWLKFMVYYIYGWLFFVLIYISQVLLWGWLSR